MFLQLPCFNYLCHIYLQVQVLPNPSKDEFCRIIESYRPSIVYLQGEQLENDEVGSLVWEGFDLFTVEAISGLFSSPLPTTVCSTSFLNFQFRICLYHFVIRAPAKGKSKQKQIRTSILYDYSELMLF